MTVETKVTPHECTYTIWIGGQAPYVIIPFDVATDAGRHTYHLMIDIYSTSIGVDNEGTRACVNPTATVIDGRKPQQFKLVEFGQIISTPFGDFRLLKGRHRDNLLVECLPFVQPK